MAARNNFLLGSGEKLTAPVEVPSGGGDKNPPYSFANARARLATGVARTTRGLNELPAGACPNDLAVALVTMHPRYISKSDFPTRFLNATGLQAIGTRARRVSPEAWGIKKPPESAVTEQIFVSGLRSTFRNFDDVLRRVEGDAAVKADVVHIEDISALDPHDKLKGIPAEGSRSESVLLEVGLHLAAHRAALPDFLSYARALGGEPVVARQRIFDELAFVPVRIPLGQVLELAKFSFVRVARIMPRLRPIPVVGPRLGGTRATLPSEGPLDPTCRAVIFDGGLPPFPDLSLWVRYVEPAEIGPAAPRLLDHGLAVTGAALFGPIPETGPLARPYCAVDHVRVLDTTPDFECLDALERIEKHLDEHPDVYEFINISLGPELPIDDDEVTPWTIAIDRRLAGGNSSVCCVAAGNFGRQPNAADRRIQPPSDGVNVLAIGSANSVDTSWGPADHSCKGPGRSPGAVKPDVLAFGGCRAKDLFPILTPSLDVAFVEGTSVAAPTAMRVGAGVRVAAGASVKPLGVRALMIHYADQADHHQHAVGWGRIPDHAIEIVTCDDDEACVLYQGVLPVGQHLRASAPVPAGSLRGEVEIAATLVIAPEIDPARSSGYTRAGLEVSFRPDSRKFRINKVTGEMSAHPVTVPFFTEKNMYGAAEYQLRDDGSKWEPTRRHRQKFDAHKLDLPVFDIYYHHRREDNVDATKPIHYALVISLRAPEVADLYNRVLRTYASILVPLRSTVEIDVRT